MHSLNVYRTTVLGNIVLQQCKAVHSRDFRLQRSNFRASLAVAFQSWRSQWARQPKTLGSGTRAGSPAGAVLVEKHGSHRTVTVNPASPMRERSIACNTLI